MIFNRQGIAKIVILILGVLSLLLFIAYIWVGHSFTHLNPLTSITNQKAEEFLSHALGQKVQIGKISDLSFNRLVLEDMVSGAYLSETGKPKTRFSFRIPRAVIRVDLWQYLWQGQINSVSIHLDRPDVKLDGSVPSSASQLSAGLLPAGLGDLRLQVAISKGRLSYIGGTAKEPILVDSIGGTVEIGSQQEQQLDLPQIRITPLQFSWGGNRMRLQGQITAKNGKDGQLDVDMVLTTDDKSRLRIGGNIHVGPPFDSDLSLKVEQLSLRQLMTFARTWSSASPSAHDVGNRQGASLAKSDYRAVLNGIKGPGLKGAINGVIEGKWRLYGQMDSFKADGDFALSRLEYGGVSLGEIAGQMEADGEGLRLYDMRGSFLGGTIVGHAMLAGGEDSDYDCRLTIDGIEPARIAILTKAWQIKVPPIALEILSELRAAIRVSPGPAGPKWEADWQTRWQGNDIGGVAVLNPDGTYTVEGKSEDILLSELLQQAPSGWRQASVTGTMDVSATVNGSWGEKPESRAEAYLQGLTVDDVDLGHAHIHGRLDGKRFVVDEAQWHTNTGTIALGGSISWGEVIDLWFKTPELEVERLPWLAEYVPDLEGTVVVSGTWQGPWGQSALSAELSGQNLLFSAPGLPGVVSIPRVDAELQGSRMELVPFELHYGDGTISVAGTVSLDKEPVLDLKGKVAGVGYDSKPLAGRLSGDISVSGVWPTPLLAGRLLLDQGRLDLARLGETSTSSLSIPLAVDLTIDESLTVTGAGLLDVAAGGVLQIAGSTSAPEVRGRIEVVRGQIVYFGTPFQVVRGWADFRPYQELIPDVYLEGSGKVKGLPVTLLLQGPGNDMRPTLHSEQGLSERELLGMLSIPEKVNTVLDDGLGQVFRREMRELLAGQFKLHVLGGLERRLQDALGLDEFELEPGLSDGQVRLELGKYITKDVFVAYTQTVYPHWENQWHLDYRLNHGLRLSTTWNGDKGYTMGIEVKLDF